MRLTATTFTNFHSVIRQAICLGALCLHAPVAFAHDGPDPIARWKFGEQEIQGTQLIARLGPNAEFSSAPDIEAESVAQSVRFRRGLSCTVANDFRSLHQPLPQSAFTISAWVAIDQGEDWGGIACLMQDNGDAETGWVLGYDQQVFTLGLSTVGADDGDGKLTYIKGTTEWDPGKLYHVVGTYDGEEMCLFVNGKLEAQSASQSGDVLYPQSAPFVLGAYKDANEDYRLRGRISEVSIYDVAATAMWVEHEFREYRQLAEQEARLRQLGQGFVVSPYLQFGTQTSMTVMWRTATPSSTTVYWGETAECTQVIKQDGTAEIHEVKIEDLKPETQYFYAVESVSTDGATSESEVLTFSTAVKAETPFAFAIISDTQGNPEVSLQLAEQAWAQRPNFCIHSGDLVSTGGNPKHWTQHFFPGMKPLIERVPFYPVLGNHEDNAKNYFDYVSLPNPEYYYSFKYGNTEFFMIDSNRDVSPESEQYKWLDGALAASDAEWKFVCHHHPPYSSDENDYGNLWKTNKSTQGDLRVRQLTTLYDQHQVDIVWNGHIHSYERTWPVYDGAAQDKGTVYMITGGGGGGLETPGPFRPFFQNNVKRGHHYCMVAIQDETLELKAFDLEGRLFDYVQIEKQGR